MLLHFFINDAQNQGITPRNENGAKMAKNDKKGMMEC
jgi:hypothetical protein